VVALGCATSLVLLPGEAASQATIRGRVSDLDSGRALATVEVRLRGTAGTAVTDADGRFRLTGVMAGTWWLEFRMLGYEERADSVTVGPDDAEVDVDVRLATRPVELDPMTVTVRVGAIAAWLASRGFPQRRAEARSLLHATHDEIRHTAARNLNELLQRVPSVRIRRFVDGRVEVWLEPSPLPDGQPCRVAVYLNGAAVELGRFTWTGVRGDQRASRPIRFDDVVLLGDIDAIELYGPSESPVAGERGCGTLLVWNSMLRPQLDEEFTGSVRGVAVNDSTGAVMGGVKIRLRPGGLEAITDAAGRFEFPALLPGDYEILAEYPGAEPWRGVVTVRAFGVIDVELRLES
jgi:hypothetical protein